MAEYVKVYKRIWNDHRFSLLDDDCQLMYIYLLSSPHGNTTGFFFIKSKYIEADLNWTEKRIERNLRKLKSRDFILYENQIGSVFLKGWWNYNDTTNPNLRKKIEADLSEMTESPLWYDLKPLIPSWLITAFERHSETVPTLKLNSETETETEEEEESLESNKSKSNLPAVVKKNQLDKKIKERIPYKAIIDHLNQLSGRNYKHDGVKTREKIKARFNDGFRLHHFLRVNETKVKQWIKDPEMSKFIRPETLYGNKFEGYYNEDANIAQVSSDQAKGIVGISKAVEQIKSGQKRLGHKKNETK